MFNFDVFWARSKIIDFIIDSAFRFAFIQSTISHMLFKSTLQDFIYNTKETENIKGKHNVETAG